MVEEKQVYVSFNNLEYKNSKQVLLLSQFDLVNLQKRVYHLKAIRSAKRRLISQLYRCFSKLNIIADRLDKKLPDSKLPKGIKLHKKRVIKEKVFVLKKADEEQSISDLDKELLDIQERLKKLNG